MSDWPNFWSGASSSSSSHRSVPSLTLSNSPRPSSSRNSARSNNSSIRPEAPAGAQSMASHASRGLQRNFSDVTATQGLGNFYSRDPYAGNVPPRPSQINNSQGPSRARPAEASLRRSTGTIQRSSASSSPPGPPRGVSLDPYSPIPGVNYDRDIRGTLYGQLIDTPSGTSLSSRSYNPPGFEHSYYPRRSDDPESSQQGQSGSRSERPTVRAAVRLPVEVPPPPLRRSRPSLEISRGASRGGRRAGGNSRR